ncbi:MAG TPA: 23S rRNA (adenine(2503)-C(2))-methyltransferase RlmN [Bacteroidales bacterium]|nr:23S rRNA (adenine(2503)-C(2))-methyltransferase RlmN [Bacteroidales bacterium]
MEKIKLCGLSLNDLCRNLQIPGFSVNHALKVTNSLYKKGIESFDLIPGIPSKIKKELGNIAVTGTFAPAKTEVSADGTMKFLFGSEGKKYETVYMPDEKRHTVCVSSQSGCRMGCPVCVTGKYGFHGNLSAGEIVNQVLSIPDSQRLTHVVFMGMGEPMDNIDNVLKACEILTAEWGRAIGKKNITVSSVGITDGIRRFLNESDCNLAVSLFSPFPEERSGIVPVERKYPVAEIARIMNEFSAAGKRRLTFTYVMIRGLNDTGRHLEGLKELVRGTGIRINLLPYHRVPHDAYSPSSAERMSYFRHELMMSGISASVRRSRGDDISAACGLLASGLKNI